MIIRTVLPPLIPPGSTVTTVNMTYSDSEWGDLLTSYDGHAITYDEIGNPLSYYNGSAYAFTWEGRRLVGAVKGSTNMSFTYNNEGIRTSKTVNGVTHTYYLNGSQITAEQWEDKLLVYLYDASGAPIGMMYRTTSYDIDEWDTFFFEKNLQGDIVTVYNSDGVACITYKYDAWGNFKESYVGNAPNAAWRNPFRYRGYYYDTDLGMYYLQSRYYDAKVCRFINADGALYHNMLGYNLFAYCENNPVNMLDTTGQYCVDIMDNDGNPFNDWMDLVGQGGGGAKAGYYGPGTAYYNYQVRMGTAAYDARLGGYHSLGLSSAMINPNYYCVSGAVSVTDSMAISSSQSSNRFLPDKYYTNNEAPLYSTPNSSNYTVKYNDYTKKFEISSTYYDYAGRQIIRIDWTNHGRADHGNPHIHFRTYSNTYPDGFKWRIDEL